MTTRTHTLPTAGRSYRLEGTESGLGAGRGWAILKRTFDITFALIAILSLIPLLAVVSAAILIASRGPLLFRQRRYGRDMKPLTVLKFRTMVDGASTDRHREFIASLAAGEAKDSCFYALAYVPSAGGAAGSSYQRSVTFTAAGQNGCAVGSPATAVGPCSVNPCLAPPPPDGGTETLPSAGAITIDGAQMPPLTLEPGSDGAYAPNVVMGQLAWTAGGAQVTFQWTHLPGDPSSPGGSLHSGRSDTPGRQNRAAWPTRGSRRRSDAWASLPRS